jgi:hypothetical protein
MRRATELAISGPLYLVSARTRPDFGILGVITRAVVRENVEDLGLLLATPLTACLVVLGRYFTAFNICSVLLAAEPPSSSETKFMASFIKLEIPDALIFVGLWRPPAEGAARWVRRIRRLPEALSPRNIDQGVEGIASRVPRVGNELQAGAENATQAGLTQAQHL